MSTAPLAEYEPIGNLAELLDRLGNVPPERVLMRPAPGTATEADVLAALEAPRKRICELIDGVLVEKAMGFRESRLAMILGRILDLFVTARNLGLVTAPDGTIRMWPGRVRIPDVAYYSWGRLPGRRLPEDPIPMVAPDLSIEILSRSNTKKEMRLKREDLFKRGTRLVWEIDPEKRTASVYTSPEKPASVLTEKDKLSGGKVLPGFSLSLKKLFAELDRHG